MANHLGVCAVVSGQERRAQHEIERAGFGTRVPGYRVAYRHQGKRHVMVRPLFPGYVFPYLGAGWGEIAAIDGVMVLSNNGKASRLTGAGEERLAQLELHCVLGDFNRIQYRAANGFFEARKRKRKPRRSKRLYRANNTYAKS